MDIRAKEAVRSAINKADPNGTPAPVTSKDLADGSLKNSLFSDTEKGAEASAAAAAE